MQRITCYLLLAVGALVAPIVGRAQAPKAQAPQAQAPQPKVREIATIPGVDVRDAIRMPNGRVILYGRYENGTGAIFAYDLPSKRSTLVTRGYDGEMSMSRAGDRIAYESKSEDGKIDLIWSIPINPTTGVATGPAQRVARARGSKRAFRRTENSLRTRRMKTGRGRKPIATFLLWCPRPGVPSACSQSTTTSQPLLGVPTGSGFSSCPDGTCSRSNAFRWREAQASA